MRKSVAGYPSVMQILVDKADSVVIDPHPSMRVEVVGVSRPTPCSLTGVLTCVSILMLSIL